jgi:hypothetical protein
MVPQPDPQRAQAAEGEVTIIGAWDIPEGHGGVLDLAEQGVGPGGNHPNDEVRMAGNILGPHLDREIHAMAKGFEKQRRPPGIIQEYERVPGVGDRDDGRDILDVKHQRTRGFARISAATPAPRHGS